MKKLLVVFLAIIAIWSIPSTDAHAKAVIVGISDLPNSDSVLLEAFKKGGSGFYYFSNGAVLKLRHAELSTSKTKDGLAQVSGLFSNRSFVVINNTESITKFTEVPMVYLWIADEIPSKRENQYLNLELRVLEDISLVKLDIKKDSREVVIGKASGYSSKNGIPKKNKMPITIKKNAIGAYEISATNRLSEGEYAFMYSGKSGIYITGQSPYDFSIIKK